MVSNNWYFAFVSTKLNICSIG